MDNKIISPCISICRTDPVTGFCYGCARTNDEKKQWKDENSTDKWKEENLKIPKSTNYKLVGSLSNEIVEKLSKIKPPTLGAASRISGVTPAATIALLRYIKKNKNKKAA